METPKTGYGIEIEFQSGFIANILDVTLPEEAREKIDVSHTLSPEQRMEYIMADLVDSGELEVEMLFSPDVDPPIDEPFSVCILRFGSGTEWTVLGALMNYGGEAPLDDKMTANATIAITGKINRSASGGS
jgi:hypothetical protein